MGFGKLKLIMLILAGMVFYAACRKIDFRPEKEREKVPADERFFTRNISSNPLVQSLAAYMKRRNEKDSFVNTTVSRIGYPRWDKAFMKGGQLLGRGYSDSSIIIYVPFVRENENFTNASLVAEISPNDTAFDYLCDWQFHEKEYASAGIESSAEAHALFFMFMDRIVFGHTIFKVTDDSLFLADSMTRDGSLRKIQLINTPETQGRIESMVVPQTICYSYLNCPSSVCHENGYCDYPNCPSGVCTMESRCITVNVVVEGNPGGNGNGNGSGGSSGGGGGSGGGTPPNCNPTAVRGLNANPNCEPGWQPDPPLPPPPPPPPDTLLNPCLDAANLQNSASFISYMQELKDSTNSNREYGYLLFKDPSGIFGNTPHGLMQGPENRLGLTDFSNSYLLDAIVHSHFNTGTDSTKGSSVFSADDLWTMCSVFNDGNMNDPATFSMGLVTKNGTQYLLKIDNLTKFRKWARDFTTGDFDLFKRAYVETLDIRPDNSDSINEKNFLRYLTSSGGSGPKLFRGNSTFTEWTPLGLDGARNVISLPCQ